MTTPDPISRRKLVLLTTAWLAAPALASFGQTNSAPAKPLAFDTFSIRPSKPGSQAAFTTDILPDGYRARNQSLYHTIMAAYSNQFWMFWSEDRFHGAPSWVTTDLYDIDARVAPEDIAQWQRQGNDPAHRQMFHAMLQAALADRCKLVLHRIPSEAPGYVLTIGKRGPKLKDAPPGEAAPTGGMPLPDGGKVSISGTQMTFIGASIPSFVVALTMFSRSSAGTPLVQDKTGLTGRYDFVVPRREANATPPADRSAPDPIPAIPWDLGEIGLNLKPAKVPTESLVIDHIERPTPN